MKSATFLLAVLAATAAAAAPSVVIESVRQRYPWNNKIDITYTVEDGQTAGKFYALEFILQIGGETLSLNQDNVGAPVTSGRHTVTWTLDEGLYASGCSTYAMLYDSEFAGGDDYLVVDASTGECTHEGVWGTQAASDERYDNATHKGEKLVLRRVRAGYRNVQTNTMTAAMANDYYMGIFETTVAQYNRIMGTGATSTYTPKVNISWNDIRASAAPGEAVPASADCVIAKLNAKTGVYFDLPTESMWEIAAHGGADPSWRWFFGTTKDGISNYAQWEQNNNDIVKAPGTKLPNAWGLFDVYGNAWEWCIDSCEYFPFTDGVNGDIMTSAGMNLVQIPVSGYGYRMLRGGGCQSNSHFCRSGFRRQDHDADFANPRVGFRLSTIVDKPLSGANFADTSSVRSGGYGPFAYSGTFAVDTRSSAADGGTRTIYSRSDVMPVTYCADAAAVTLNGADILSGGDGSQIAWAPGTGTAWTLAWTDGTGLLSESVSFVLVPAVVSGAAGITQWTPVSADGWTLVFTTAVSNVSGPLDALEPDRSFSLRAETGFAAIAGAPAATNYAGFAIQSAAADGGTASISLSVTNLVQDSVFIKLAAPRKASD